MQHAHKLNKKKEKEDKCRVSQLVPSHILAIYLEMYQLAIIPIPSSMVIWFHDVCKKVFVSTEEEVTGQKGDALADRSPATAWTFASQQT